MAAGVRGCVDRTAARWDNRLVFGIQRSIFMANSVIQTSIDEKINAEAATVLAEMGMTVSQAIRLMLTRVAQEKRLPFDPVLTPREETLAALQEARSESLKSYANMAELLQDLDDA
jgi:addiction module antitoxin, relB/dinJ family